METLDLTSLKNSVIKYEISKFPDGQQNIRITSGPWDKAPIMIKSRLNSWTDLELIVCAVSAFRNKYSNEIKLYVPYLLGARSDRAFEPNGVNYLKQVICPIINSLNLSEVISLDPHSDVTEACINNFKRGDLWAFYHEIYENEKKLIVETFLGPKEAIKKDLRNVVIVAPDAGAYKRAEKVAKQWGVKKLITCNKVRDLKTGKITKTEVSLVGCKGKDFILIDDICDGGRTFEEIAKVIKAKYPKAKITLVVTHGIFSKGHVDVDKIYTTNSCQNSNFMAGQVHASTIGITDVFKGSVWY
mgnify:CR=1 FL=1